MEAKKIQKLIVLLLAAALLLGCFVQASPVYAAEAEVQNSEESAAELNAVIAINNTKIIAYEKSPFGTSLNIYPISLYKTFIRRIVDIIFIYTIIIHNNLS